jgi:hypothetical protein
MAAPSKNAGLLTIRRAPKFGTRVTLNVSIDGAQVASLREGQSYNGTLSPREARHIRERDAGLWSWRHSDKAHYGKGGTDLQLHRVVEQ